MSALNTILTDSTSVAGSGNSNFGSWTFNGSTSATARQGQLKSQSQNTHTGGGDGQTTNSSESYSILTETLRTVSSGVVNGTAGTMRIEMTIDGMMSVLSHGTVGLKFMYDYGAGRPGYPFINRTLLEAVAVIYGNGYDTGINSYLGAQVIPPGMTFDIGPLNPHNLPDFITFGGSTKVYADIPMTFGLDTEFRMGLLTWTNFGSGGGTAESLFGNTATMTGIEIFDNNNQPVQDFTLISGSGTAYNANGVVLTSAAAPEPGTLLLLVLPMLGFARRLRATRGK